MSSPFDLPDVWCAVCGHTVDSGHCGAHELTERRNEEKEPTDGR